jgi:ParB/RepB/Spo0J family partition protein
MKKEKAASPKITAPASAFEFREIPLNELSESRDFAFRKGPFFLEGLRDSIRHGGGQKMEIAVRPDKAGKFQIIYGFRRVVALQKEGKPTVLAKIYPKLSDEEALRLRFAENTGRQDYTPYEIVMICQELKERFKYSEEEIGRMIGRNRVSVNRYLSVARVPRVLKRLEDGEIGFKEAYELATRAEEAEKLRQAAPEGTSVPKVPPNLKPRLEEVRKTLKDSFPGVSVSIQSGAKRSEPALNIFGLNLKHLKSFFEAGKSIFQPFLEE